MLIDYPFSFENRGRTASVDYDAHIRDLIEQVLFTAPGERVNRPTFGSGLMQLVFAPADDALAAATQLTIHGALQQWLSELITVESVDVTSVEAVLRVQVVYTVLRTGERTMADFERSA